MRSKIFNKQCGQAAILYALLVPILILVGGVGLDLGWYYLNVSRLQNAADAAVLAGGKTLLEEIKIKNKKDVYVTLKSKNYRAKLVYQYPNDKPDTTGTDITAGNETALSYAKKNLSSSSIGRLLFSVAEAEDETISYMLKDSYITGDLMVSMTPSLYIDGEDYYYVIGLNEDIPHFFMSGWFDDMNAPVVAVALLSKKVSTVNGSKDPVTITFDPNGGKFSDGTTSPIDNSFKNPATLEDDEDPDKLTSGKDGKPTFTDSLGNDKIFAGWSYVDPSTIDTEKGEKPSDYFVDEGTPLTEELLATIQEHGGVLYAVYIRNNKTLWEQMQYLAAKYVHNYYWQTSTAKYGQSPINNNFTYRRKYYVNEKDKNFYYAAGKYVDNKKQITEWSAFWDYTPAYYVETIDFDGYDRARKQTIATADHYYLDFCQVHDADLNLKIAPQESLKLTNVNDRIDNHLTDYPTDSKGNPNLDYYGNLRRVHALFNVNTTLNVRSGKKDDPLFCRIESEPYAKERTAVRQIVININVDNTADDKRPLFIFYDGPARSETNGQYPAATHPVILNLNANFKGVLFMPDIPVVINGNDYMFEGFIIAKEYRYLDTESGTPVKYSTDGKYDKNYSDNKIRVNTSTGNVYTKTVKPEKELKPADTLAMWDNNGVSKFRLNINSKFKQFYIDDDVTNMYAFYDYSDEPILDERPFHEYWDTSNPLIALYNTGGHLVTSWSNVKLYNSDNILTRIEIPKTITTANMETIKQLTSSSVVKKATSIANMKGIVLFDSNNNPISIYDEAGNPIYFCDDYFNLTGRYTVLTLDRVEDGTRKEKEFLLTADTTNVSANSNISNTDDWK